MVFYDVNNHQHQDLALIGSSKRNIPNEFFFVAFQREKHFLLHIAKNENKKKH